MALRANLSAYCLLLAIGAVGCSSEPSDAFDAVSSKLAGSTVGSNKGIMWGVNAHPLSWGSIYETQTFDQQMAKLSSMGLRHYRMDLYGPANDQYTVLDKVLAAATPHGIVVTPALIPIVAGGGDESAAYQTGYRMGVGYGQRYKGKVHVWEIGNEENGKSGVDPFSDGSDPATFQRQPAYAVTRGKLRGVIDGIRASDPSAKVAVGDAGGCNYGFTQALYDDGLRWDITLFHPYDFWGPLEGRVGKGCAAGNNMIAKHAAYGKPIWLTEFSFTPAVTSPDKQKLGQGIVAMMKHFNDLASQYDIEEADIYELYDGQQAGAEGHFGLYDGAGGETAAVGTIRDFITSRPSALYDNVSAETPVVPAPSPTPGPAPVPAAPDAVTLAPFSLTAGQSINQNGWDLTMQTDGNLVLYHTSDSSKVLWASQTYGRSCAGCKVYFQTDGNLVLYTAAGVPYWSTNTQGRNADTLTISSSALPLIIKAGDQSIWSATRF